ncbi:MAG TPA: hypothetical protein VMU20_09285 [Candidatus Dormibacteraeota bacterium]|nr:hypothetical protein [Candidatus Dormibacteraeota bacterium]
MPLVVITFHDGEVLWADTPTIGFDLPVIEAEIRNVDSNSERALLPLAAIRLLIIGEVRPAPPAETLAGWDKAAFHFLDGHVLRAWLGPEVRLGPHGGVWELVEHGTPDPELRTIGVPWSSLKGVFQIRQWDSRPATERAARAAGEPVHLENMIRVLAEREARAVEPRAQRSEASLAQRLQRAREREDDSP